MKYKYLNWFITLIILCLQLKTNAQSPTPGGIESPLYWFKTTKENTGKSIWKDDDNTRKSILMDPKTNSRNINFHDAYSFDGKEEIELHNCNVNQLTIIGAFYPEYDFSLKLKSDQFYSVLCNDIPIYKFTSDKVDIDKSNISENVILPYDKNGNFKITSNAELNKSMKIGSYNFSRLSNNLNNPWGEENETKLEFNFAGYIPEFLFYSRVLKEKELNRVHSYLAIKYGLTIEMNYYNSNGEVIWDQKKNKTFHNRVSAIGKDINGAINQVKSNSTYEELYENKHSFYYDATGINRSVTIGFNQSEFINLNDRNFLFWGDDNASILSNDLYQIDKIRFPDLFATKRNWIMQNENLILSSTQITIGNPLLEQLNNKIATPCYYLIIQDGNLDIKDFFPFKNNQLNTMTWLKNITTFSFAVGEKLRFKVKTTDTSIYKKPSKCSNEPLDEFNEKNYKDKPKNKNGYYCYKEEGPIDKCIYRIVYIYKNQALNFYCEGGIGDYNYEITDLQNPALKVKGSLQRRKDKTYEITSLNLKGKYKFTITDQTNQTIEFELIIK